MSARHDDTPLWAQQAFHTAARMFHSPDLDDMAEALCDDPNPRAGVVQMPSAKAPPALRVIPGGRD